MSTEDAVRIDPREEAVIRYQACFLAGVEPAAMSAYVYCLRHRWPCPKWALDAMYQMSARHLLGLKPKKKGRAAGGLARYRQDLIHFTRWDAVKEARGKQAELRQQEAEIRSLDEPPQELLVENARKQMWAGGTWDRVYEVAASLLRGTAAYASPASIKASYLYIEKQLKDPVKAARFYSLDPWVLQILGLRDVSEPPADKKVPPMFHPDR